MNSLIEYDAVLSDKELILADIAQRDSRSWELLSCVPVDECDTYVAYFKRYIPDVTVGASKSTCLQR